MTLSKLENAIAIQTFFIVKYQAAINANIYAVTADEMQRLSSAIAGMNGLESLRQKLTGKASPIPRNGNGYGGISLLSEAKQ